MTRPKPTTPAITRDQEAIMTHGVDGFQVSTAPDRGGKYEPKYDLKAMGYGQYLLPDAFVWSATPQGYAFWNDHFFNQPSDEGRAALAEMREQWEKENG